MNIKYRQLKAFVLAYEAGSFREAASRLAITQSSFSALIQELENDIGGKLFERTTRSSRPTDAGRNFYERIRAPLAELEDSYGFVTDFGRGLRGTLSFAVLPSLASGFAARNLADYQRAFPDVRIKLRERKHGELLEDVRNGIVEFGIGVMLRPDNELTFKYLFSDQLMFVAPRGHDLTKMAPVWNSLEKFDFVCVGHGNTDYALALGNVRAAPAYEVEHVATALAMVRYGMGVSVLPSSIIGSLNVNGLACIPIEGDSAIRSLGLICKRYRPLTAAARAFATQIEQSLPGISPRLATASNSRTSLRRRRV